MSSVQLSDDLSFLATNSFYDLDIANALMAEKAGTTATIEQLDDEDDTPFSSSIPTITNGIVQQPKRLQVPKACSNCRKMHAACGVERPCKRCITNGLESTCVDIPRKKRASRKRTKAEMSSSDDSSTTTPPTDLNNNPLQTKNNNSTPPNLSADGIMVLNNNNPPTTTNNTSNYNPYLEAWRAVVEFDEQQNNQLMPLPELLSPYSSSATLGATEQALLADWAATTSSVLAPNSPSSIFSPLPSSSPIDASILGFPSTPVNSSPSSQLNSSPSPTTPPPSNNNQQLISANVQVNPDITYLVQQITQLQENNKTMEERLMGVTKELNEIKGPKTISPIPQQQPDNQIQTLGGWHSFQPQPDLAISVWKVAGQVGCGSNVLIECNDKFVELLGYPMEVLRNSFTCGKLIRRKEVCPDDRESNGRNWPKRTQIITAFGLKDVFITISPVTDQFSNPKYYIVHILEVRS